jgi:hypothetical protein
MKQQKQTYTYLLYALPPPKRMSGILGDIDLYSIYFLLQGGKYLIEEKYDGTDPIKWYVDYLEEQGIVVKSTKTQQFKKKNYIWLEVDYEQTPIDEFTQWLELDSSDTETLAWRCVRYPCSAGTTKECLGFAVAARDTVLQKCSNPLTIGDVCNAILS